ncbi:hypothetical protein [uncultured Kordia sp.]|uniref:hypothetical protein n=1 Tax=uncultured Kordia sp. TaxID=507699 RepID=UPI002624669A|nr:hypothetical protein [uncultured Kordia sp.]
MKEKPKYTESDIQSLESRVHVRLRPQLYFEKVYAEKSLDRLPLEVACHAFDKFMSKKCSYLKVTLYSDRFSIEYDAGMSLKREFEMSHAEIIMTQMRACHNLKEHLAVGSRFCEVGMMVINAASEWCTLHTYSNGEKGEFLFKEGKTETRTICSSDENKNYTKLTVKPDATIFPDLTINPTTLQEKIDGIRKKLNGFDIQLFIEN